MVRSEDGVEGVKGVLTTWLYAVDCGLTMLRAEITTPPMVVVRIHVPSGVSNL
jgi:hypothetical protein